MRFTYKQLSMVVSTVNTMLKQEMGYDEETFYAPFKAYGDLYGSRVMKRSNSFVVGSGLATYGYCQRLETPRETARKFAESLLEQGFCREAKYVFEQLR